MFRYLRSRWEIRRLERRARSDEEGTKKAIERAQAENAPRDEIDEITGGSDAGVLRYKIQEIQSDHYESEAIRLGIPLPDEDKYEIDESDYPPKYILKHDAINELRSAIRAEKKARAELFLMWVPGIVGILGALIGLASVLKGK